MIESGDSARVCAGIRTTPVPSGAIEEQALCVISDAGPILITGCAHPGVLNLARACAEVAGDPVYAVLGGLHLKDAWSTEINSTIAELRSMGVRKVGPCHCSGEQARERMSRVFGKRYLSLSVGSQISLDPAGD